MSDIIHYIFFYILFIISLEEVHFQSLLAQSYFHFYLDYLLSKSSLLNYFQDQSFQALNKIILKTKGIYQKY